MSAGRTCKVFKCVGKAGVCVCVCVWRPLILVFFVFRSVWICQVCKIPTSSSRLVYVVTCTTAILKFRIDPIVAVIKRTRSFFPHNKVKGLNPPTSRQFRHVMPCIGYHPLPENGLPCLSIKERRWMGWDKNASVGFERRHGTNPHVCITCTLAIFGAQLPLMSHMRWWQWTLRILSCQPWIEWVC